MDTMEANLQRSVAKWSPFRSAVYPTRFRCVTVTAGPRQPSKQQEDVKDVVVRRLDRRALLASVGAAVALSTGNSGALAEVQVCATADASPAVSLSDAFAIGLFSIWEHLAAITHLSRSG